MSHEGENVNLKSTLRSVEWHAVFAFVELVQPCSVMPRPSVAMSRWPLEKSRL